MTNTIDTGLSAIQNQIDVIHQTVAAYQSIGPALESAAQAGSFSSVLSVLTDAETAGTDASTSAGTSAEPSTGSAADGLLGSVSSGGSTSPAALEQMLGSLTSGGVMGTGSTAADTLGLSGSGGSQVTGSQVVANAQQYLGIPYQWGGTSTSTGFDCSGLVQHVYGDLGIPLPRTSEQQALVGQPVDSLADAVPGDLLFFEPSASGPGHVGIYAGNGQMIAAPHTGTDVQLQDVPTTPCAIRRILPDGASAAGGVLGATNTTDSLVGATGGTSSLGSINVPSAYVPMFLSAAGTYGIPAQLLAAVAQTESNFNPNAVSSAGAEGMMQIMPSTAAGIGVDPMDPSQAINGAAQILSGDLRKFGGSVPLALAAYNAGAGAVEEYGGIPPYPETQAYVQKITSLLGEPS